MYVTYNFVSYCIINQFITTAWCKTLKPAKISTNGLIVDFDKCILDELVVAFIGNALKEKRVVGIIPNKFIKISSYLHVANCCAT